ncbi:peptidoglycan D,D-transpeptidase FtsI family protein [Desulfotomaculum copahuensis]|uniref:Peptidoglycan glycosyltransferase n=1 Tax=Desulfotomaculum copahuensis TaxID=1838280 RepID=A0A1B7LAP3_9FIRM|nr:penicillin-binding protein 2 [Desulfotomaculum copahuensis]OAT79399.1 peptidoglycan glycosyltransferase [Desulfotomaculum copahuensis]
MGILRSRRMAGLFYILFFCFLLMVAHLAVIQLVRGDHYAFKALEQETMSVDLEDYPRGQILDRHLQSLTGETKANRVVVFPGLIPGREAVAVKLAGILNVDPVSLTPFLTGDPCYLPFTLTPAQSAAIRKQNWPGVLVLPVSFRYGAHPLANQVTGYLGHIDSGSELAALNQNSSKEYRLGDWVGKAGLEKYYEPELKATRPLAAARVFIDAAGRPLPGVHVNSREPDPGRDDVVTTIDAGIQRKVEAIMDKKIDKGAVVVMDPHTGDILAMASRPSFDPQPDKLPHYLASSPQGAFLDQCTTLFQPGSVFKIVVAAAALAEGAVTPQSTFTCLGDKDPLVHCWYAPGHGTITFARGFAESCDPTFAQVGLKLGAAKLIKYARLFGMDNQQITGYPVPRDNRQNLQLIAAPHALVNSSIGQGPVLETPVQIAAMLNVIVNNGVYIQPRLVKEIRSSGGRVVKTFPAAPGKRAIPPATAEEMRRLLYLVTTRGTGQAGYVSGYGSAGKTGTAQVDGRGKLNAWFCGYAPVDHPRYVVVVLARGDGVSGGASAAPVFQEIINSLMASK